MKLLWMVVVVVVVAVVSWGVVEGGSYLKKRSLDGSVSRVDPDKVMFCYYPSWSYWRPGSGKFLVEDINLSLCSHLLYAFATLNPSTLTIQPSDTWLDLPTGLNNYGKFTALKQQKPGLKTLLTLGGWTDSRGSPKYSNLVALSSRRQNFITHAINFLQTYGFDGLDLDWEYPAYSNEGRPEDKVNFGLFVSELKAAFSPLGLSLTAAVSASEVVINDGFDIPVLATHLDYIQIMTYDFHGSWDTQADHHAPLLKRDYDATNFYAEYSVSYWITAGAPASKLLLGVPLYGRSFTLSTADTTPLAPASGPGNAGSITGAAGFLSYQEICSNLLAGWTEVSDPTGKMGPYAYYGTQWVGYDDVAMVQQKAQFVTDQGMAGAMVWAIDMDDVQGTCGQGSYPLLTALSADIFNPPATTTTTATTPTTTTTETTTTTTTTTTPTSTTTATTTTPTTTTTATTTTPTTTTTATTTTTTPTTTTTTCNYEVYCTNNQKRVKLEVPGLPAATFRCSGGQTFDTALMQCISRVPEGHYCI